MTRGRMKPKLTEADVQRTCTAWLERDGWRALKLEPVHDPGRKRGSQGFGEIGMTDYIYIRYLGHELNIVPPNFTRPVGFLNWFWGVPRAILTQTLWWEWKRFGEKPTAAQLRWHEVERARGAYVGWSDSIESFMEAYRTLGLARRVR